MSEKKKADSPPPSSALLRHFFFGGRAIRFFFFVKMVFFFSVHGTLQASDHFILPWLIFHVPLIIGLFCAFVCIFCTFCACVLCIFSCMWPRTLINKCWDYCIFFFDASMLAHTHSRLPDLCFFVVWLYGS